MRRIEIIESTCKNVKTVTLATCNWIHLRHVFNHFNFPNQFPGISPVGLMTSHSLLSESCCRVNSCASRPWWILHLQQHLLCFQNKHLKNVFHIEQGSRYSQGNTNVRFTYQVSVYGEENGQKSECVDSWTACGYVMNVHDSFCFVR